MVQGARIHLQLATEPKVMLIIPSAPCNTSHLNLKDARVRRLAAWFQKEAESSNL